MSSEWKVPELGHGAGNEWSQGFTLGLPDSSI